MERFKLNKKGFTLAETLITLGIIGVVAAITLPAVLQKQNNKANVAKLQKVYSILSQAHLFAVLENGDVESWNISDNIRVSTPEIFSYYEPYLKLIKKCDHSPGCWATKTKSLIGDCALWGCNDRKWGLGLEEYHIGFKFMDGVNVSFNIYNNNYSFFGLPEDIKTPYVLFFVDVNGDRFPNVLGKDIFGFAVHSKKGVIPLGTRSESNCTKYTQSTNAGFDCTYKVLREKEINY